MPRLPFLSALLACSILASPAHANDAPGNPQIDYPGFAELVLALADMREDRLLGWQEFSAGMQQGNAILLDARSETAFAAGHIEGAVNLPFPDFTDEKLLAVLGDDTDRPIFIYCNNNFSDDRSPVVTKRAPLALNIPTFINLHGYGYANVWELRDILSTQDVPWVQGGAAQ